MREEKEEIVENLVLEKKEILAKKENEEKKDVMAVMARMELVFPDQEVSKVREVTLGLV